MSNILSSLLMSADALSVYGKALGVAQNNVVNSSTPGYARQSQTLIARPFDPMGGGLGGVRAGEVQSSRDAYAEQTVRQRTVDLGQYNQAVDSLNAIEPNFDVSGKSGLPAALNALFRAFSAWGQTPSDNASRQGVVDAANGVAHVFQQTAAALTRVMQDTNRGLTQTVERVNHMVGQLAQYNTQIQRGNRNDSGLDAQVHATLEELSNYIPITAMPQTDGTTTVLLNGQTPLLIGAQQYAITYSQQESQDPAAPNPNGPPSGVIQDFDGRDITSGITTGQMGALLDIRNRVLPSYLGDAFQAGDLNTMAKAFATRVNDLLTAGTLADGVTAGIPLFIYGTATDPNNDTAVAQTLTVNPAITATQLAANSPGPPVQMNGVPLALAKLANPQDAVDQVNGQSYTLFYGSMAARIGTALSDAINQQAISESAVAQARNLRQQISGVDLNEEAMKVVEFQRGYEANARLITVLDKLTETTINILPG